MKMLAEEKELYNWAVDMFGLDTPGIRANRVIKSDLRQLTRALIRAVEERCAKMASNLQHEPCSPTMPCTCDGCFRSREIAAAVRRKK